METVEDIIYLKKELRGFLDDDGRLHKYPAKYKRQILSLYYLASKFEVDKRYTEREVNEILKEWHTFDDWAMLRRDMFDSRFLGREADGSAYWLEVEQPTLASFGVSE